MFVSFLFNSVALVLIIFNFRSVDNFTVTAEDVGRVTGVAIRRDNTLNNGWHLDKVRSD